MVNKKAKNVFQVLNWCNPDHSIEDAIDTFYVDREETSPINEMKNHLLSELDYPKLLFTGPKGCGKETEIIKLSTDRNIKKNFHVKLIFDSPEDPVKLIIEILKKVREIAKEEKVDISDDSKEIDKFLDYSFGWSIDTEATDTFKSEIPDIPGFDKLKPDEKTFKVIRKKEGGPPPKEIVKYVEKLTDKIYWKKIFRKKEVLILVANLDKIDQDKALKLFLEDAALLTGIKCFVVYTFPSELLYHQSYNQIRRNFSDIYYLSNFNSWSPEKSNESWDYNKLREILTKRINEKLFDPPETIDDLIKYSGGVPHVMLNLARHCALISSRRKAPWWWFFFPSKRKITQHILNTIINRRKGLYRNTLSKDQINILQQVNKNQNYVDKNNKEFLALLSQDLIIQYGIENDISYDVDPIVQEFLKELHEPEEEDYE